MQGFIVGRPRKFNTAEELEAKINEYFDLLDDSKETKKEKGVHTIHRDVVPTITGLCLFLGFEDRSSFYNYEDEGEFSYTIKRARMAIENHYEQNLSGSASSGSIFALKNFGWKDKQEIEQDTKLEVKFFDD